MHCRESWALTSLHLHPDFWRGWLAKFADADSAQASLLLKVITLGFFLLIVSGLFRVGICSVGDNVNIVLFSLFSSAWFAAVIFR